MRSLSAILCLLAMGAVHLKAATDVKTYKKDISTELLLPMTMEYVYGLGDGFLMANVAMDKEHHVRLYCQPGTLALGAQNYMDILNRQIRDLATRIPEATLDAMPIDFLLLTALQQTFPCHAAK